MDVEGLNAAVLNPDLRLVNTEQRGRHPAVKNPSLSLALSLLSPSAWPANAPRLLIINLRAGAANLTSQSHSCNRTTHMMAFKASELLLNVTVTVFVIRYDTEQTF